MNAVESRQLHAMIVSSNLLATQLQLIKDVMKSIALLLTMLFTAVLPAAAQERPYFVT